MLRSGDVSPIRPNGPVRTVSTVVRLASPTSRAVLQHAPFGGQWGCFVRTLEHCPDSQRGALIRVVPLRGTRSPMTIRGASGETDPRVGRSHASPAREEAAV